MQEQTIHTQKILSTAKARSADDLLSKKDFQSRFWHKVFKSANQQDSSDIHIEQTQHGLLIRFRVHGELTLFKEHADEISQIRNLINRLKLICGLDCQTTIPQPLSLLLNY